MLTGARITSLIMYAHDVAESADYYHRRLGLPVLETTPERVRLDAGLLEIWLEPAGRHGVQLFGRRDDSSDVVFLTEDLEATRAALESRGVTFERRRSYEVGLVTDFYDPNGHRLMLYQPSAESLTWPSAPKIREVWRRRGRGTDRVIGPASAPAQGPPEVTGLSGNPLIYLFMFENDQMAALGFYRDALGLALLERVHCCNQDCDAEIEGIGKYDGGGVLLSTHHMHERTMVFDDLGRPYSPRVFTPAHGQGIAPVFEVGDVEATVAALRATGVGIAGVTERDAGLFARFEDPFGHPFFLLQPDPVARAGAGESALR
ncbi:VOC family protein [Nucisporomicrobium flavum]|jgi:catechol 2,3-dioxygenase-like lactoylglutathione lyase family enzyme|uniref:VOC family protein n=1 Tax=Nucisporomicrobium flavum TaxID=2785915 RepID=UPI0018F7B20D|nr:VOC family protein [Nucisporomicrobium flavum]